MLTAKPTPFHTLTEQEYSQIQDLWRHHRNDPGTLAERFATIELAMLPALAMRLVCRADQVPSGYREQIAHAVFACTLYEPELRGSLVGELASSIYYDGGGALYLQQYGRLCHCAAYAKKQPRPTAVHASSCDLLWMAYCHAMQTLLQRPALFVDPVHLCILDMTLIERQESETHFQTDLQEVVAAYLGIDLQLVRQSWATVGWIATYRDGSDGSEPGSTLQTIYEEREALQHWLRQRGKSLTGQRVILVVDDDAPATAVTAFALALGKWAEIPLVIGTDWTAETGWYVVESIPRPAELSRKEVS